YRLRVDFAKTRPPARQMGLYGIDGQIEKVGDIFQGLIEHVLEDDDTALKKRKLRKARYRGLNGFLTHQDLHWVEVRFIGNLGCGFDRLSLPYCSAAQQVECAV